MRHRPRALAALALSGAAVAVTGATTPSAHLRVTVTGLRSENGFVRACLTADPSGFPDCQKGKAERTLTVPADDHLVLDFGTVAPGRYAISVLHDENGNGKVDRALAMIPREGFGFSRDAPVRMGPPKFAAAAFDVGDKALTTTIRMRYLL